MPDHACVPLVLLQNLYIYVRGNHLTSDEWQLCSTAKNALPADNGQRSSKQIFQHFLGVHCSWFNCMYMHAHAWISHASVLAFVPLCAFYGVSS